MALSKRIIVFACVGLGFLCSSACTQTRPFKAEKACLELSNASDFIKVRAEEKDGLLAEMLEAIKETDAIRPNSGSAYRHYIFKSSESKALLCESGPCLPVIWRFELQSGKWALINRPEGLCVS